MATLPQSAAAQLRDIKPYLTIADTSVYLYWGIMILSFATVVVAAYFLVRLVLKLRHTNRRKGYLAALKALDWHDPKHAAYEATRLGRLLLGDDAHLGELYRQMVAALAEHKYKKEVDPVTPQTKAQFELFVKGCDESL